MENQSVNSTKIILTNGILLGLSSIFLYVIMYVIGADQKNWIYSVLAFLIMVTFIALGMNHFKKENGTYMSLGQALKIGLGIALIAGIIGAIYQFVFTNYIDPEYMKNIIAAQNEQMMQQNPNMTQEQLDMIKKSQDFMASPLVLFGIGIIQSLFFGFIVSLITGLIMKKNNDSI